ncbi:MAG: hypothetical protein NTV81_04255 [Candidatus Komeilibacteria bacterium]|nr:hypothetical protein [Candidatus Komeilibacteria bacterium]
MSQENSNRLSISEADLRWAAVSYVWILWLGPILLKRDSAYIQFHAKQGMLLFVAEVIAGLIPVIGWLIGLFLIILAVMGVLEALAGRFWEMPVLGKYVKKLSL